MTQNPKSDFGIERKGKDTKGSDDWGDAILNAGKEEHLKEFEALTDK